VRKLFFGFFLLLISLDAHEGMFQSVDEKKATILQEGKNKSDCPACGMNLFQYYKTTHAIKFKDGTHRQYCSIFCIIDETKNGFLKDKKHLIDTILVVDVATLKYIDVKKAFYVVDSKKPPTMSVISTYAFGSKKDAQKFQKQNGGKITNYDTAYKLTAKYISEY
jgi:nitrous oxide reductase accessory protein NosL